MSATDFPIHMGEPTPKSPIPNIVLGRSTLLTLRHLESQPHQRRPMPTTCFQSRWRTDKSQRGVLHRRICLWMAQAPSPEAGTDQSASANPAHYRSTAGAFTLSFTNGTPLVGRRGANKPVADPAPEGIFLAGPGGFLLPDGRFESTTGSTTCPAKRISSENGRPVQAHP